MCLCVCIYICTYIPITLEANYHLLDFSKNFRKKKLWENLPLPSLGISVRSSIETKTMPCSKSIPCELVEAQQSIVEKPYVGKAKSESHTLPLPFSAWLPCHTYKIAGGRGPSQSTTFTLLGLSFACLVYLNPESI